MALPLPENPDAIPSLSLAAVTAELASSQTQVVSTPKNKVAKKSSASNNKSRRKPLYNSLLQTSADTSTPGAINEGQEAVTPSVALKSSKTHKQRGKKSSIGARQARKRFYDSDADSSADTESTEYSSTSSDSDSEDSLSEADNIFEQKGGKSMAMLQGGQGKSNFSRNLKASRKSHDRRKHSSSIDSLSFLIPPAVHPRIPHELTQFTSDSELSSCTSSDIEDTDSEKSSVASCTENESSSFVKSRTRSLSQNLQQMIITKPAETSDDSSESASDQEHCEEDAATRHKQSIEYFNVENGSELSHDTIIALSSQPNTFPCLISFTDSNEPIDIHHSSPVSEEPLDFHKEMLGDGDFEKIFDLDKSVLDKPIKYVTVTCSGNILKGRSRGSTFSGASLLEGIHPQRKRRLTLTLLDPNCYPEEFVNPYAKGTTESMLKSMNDVTSMSKKVSRRRVSSVKFKHPPFSTLSKAISPTFPTSHFKMAESKDRFLLPPHSTNVLPPRRRRPTLTILDPINLEESMSQIRSFITFHDDGEVDQIEVDELSQANQGESMCLRKPQDSAVNIMIPTVKSSTPAIYVTAIDSWLVYVAEVPVSSIDLDSTQSPSEDFVSSSRMRVDTVTLIRRVDNGWVHAPSLLKAGGVDDESVRSMILSLESKKVMIRDKKSRGGTSELQAYNVESQEEKNESMEGQLCPSLLHGVWIPLDRARSHARTSSMEHILGPFLSDHLHSLFPSVISNPTVINMLKGVPAQLTQANTRSPGDTLYLERDIVSSDTEVSCAKRDNAETGEVSDSAVDNRRKSRSLTLSAIDCSNLSKTSPRNSFMNLTPPASPTRVCYTSTPPPEAFPKCTISYPLTAGGINNFRRQNSAPLLPSEVLYEEHIARPPTPHPTSIFVTHQEILLNPESDQLLMAKLAEMSKKAKPQGIKRKKPGAPRKNGDDKITVKKSKPTGLKGRNTAKCVGGKGAIPTKTADSIVTTVLPDVVGLCTPESKPACNGNDSEEIEIIALDEEDKIDHWRVSRLTPFGSLSKKKV
jgi:hypothetical protein